MADLVLKQSRRPLVLTGGPAVGKSSTAKRLAQRCMRAAYIDLDDVRQLAVSGGVAPWKGPEGAAQQLLGARNGCALARNFLAAGFEVVLADVLTPASVEVYRAELTDVFIVHLVVDLAEAQRRATLRRTWITEEEFALLHHNDHVDPPSADHSIDVTTMSPDAQCAAIEGLWAAER